MHATVILLQKEQMQGEYAEFITQVLDPLLQARDLTVEHRLYDADTGSSSLETLCREAGAEADLVLLLGETVTEHTVSDIVTELGLAEKEITPFFLYDSRRGFACRQHGTQVLCLVGSPYEAELMVQEQVLPYFDGVTAAAICTRTIGVFGIPDTALGERLADLLMQENPTVSTHSHEGETTVCVTAVADSEETAAALARPTVDNICERLGTFVYGLDTPDLAARVVSLLKEKKMKIATAESCTAGQLSERLTRIAGVSAVFECGVAAYSKEIKHSVLGVPQDTLDKHGAVSPETASAMAVGARRISEASFGVSITGVAGPEPSEGKPVGTVYIALADEKRVWIKQLQEAHSDREQVRTMAVAHALDLSRRYLEALPALMAGSLPLSAAPSRHEVTAAPVVKQTLADRILITRARNRADTVRRAILWGLAILFLVSMIALACIPLMKSYQNERLYEDLANLYYNSDDFPMNNAVVGQFPEDMLSQFYALYNRNEDVRGWIRIDGTNISYPIMGGAYPAYYASHDFERNSSGYGVPYFDPRANLSSADAQNEMLVVYGNNPGAGQMFSDLVKYRNIAYLQQHPFITLNTIYENAAYEIFAVMYIDGTNNNAEFDYTRHDFASAAEKEQFIEALRRRSLFRVDSEVTADDALLLLSTDAADELDLENGKLVIAARKRAGDLVGTTEAPKVSQNTDVLLPQAMRPTPTVTTARPLTTTTTASTTISTSETTTTTSESEASDTTVAPDTSETRVEQDGDAETVFTLYEEGAYYKLFRNNYQWYLELYNTDGELYRTERYSHREFGVEPSEQYPMLVVWYNNATFPTKIIFDCERQTQTEWLFGLEVYSRDYYVCASSVLSTQPSIYGVYALSTVAVYTMDGELVQKVDIPGRSEEGPHHTWYDIAFEENATQVAVRYYDELLELQTIVIDLPMPPETDTAETTTTVSESADGETTATFAVTTTTTTTATSNGS